MILKIAMSELFQSGAAGGMLDLRVIKPMQIEANGPHYGIFGSTMTCSTTQTLGYPRPWTPRCGGDWQFQLCEQL